MTIDTAAAETAARAGPASPKPEGGGPFADRALPIPPPPLPLPLPTTATLATILPTTIAPRSDSETSLELEAMPAGPRSASVAPLCLEGGRPAGLVSIRFFASAGHTPTGPASASPIIPSKADDPAGTLLTRVKAQTGRGRGRPRTKSAESLPRPSLIAAALRPHPTHPLHLLLPRSSSSGGGVGEVKLPRIAPRPPAQPVFGMVQPNSLQQARALMASKDGIRDASPEMDVLRLISDACEIHSSSQEECGHGRKLRRVLPKKEGSPSTGALPLVEPRMPVAPRRLLPKPPEGKMALPSPRQQQS